nr:MAG TPA: Neurohypophysial hormone [Caudoviricetes sp.]
MQTFAKNAPQNPRKPVGGRGISPRSQKALPNSLFVAPGSKDSARMACFQRFQHLRECYFNNCPYLFSKNPGSVAIRQKSLETLAFLEAL